MSTPNSGPFALLQRIAQGRPPAPTGERCEMCAEPIGEEHSHVVNVDTRTLLCTCRPCTLLFAYDHAHLHYRAVPDRYLSFPDVHLPAALWDDLQIPVGLAFLFRNSALDRMVAFYPGPAGATESELPLGAWDQVAAAHPGLGVLVPDVEALLLRAPADDEDQVECVLVPIDRCYELVGTLRRTWRGFDGGQEARDLLAAFFADVTARARPARASSEPRP